MTILTTAEYRAFEATELSDASLQILLDASEAEIVRYAGSPTSAVEEFGGGHRTLFLYRSASAITSIVETADQWAPGLSVTLAANDYRLHTGGYAISRLSGGTNSGSCWRGRVVVTFTPADETALRKAVQVDLISLALNFSPGASSERIGAWEETFRNAVEANGEERGAILGRLSSGPYLVVVGG